MAEPAPSTSATGAISAARKQQQLENYVAGRARGTYRLNHSLQASLLEASSTGSTSTASPPTSCTKGCYQALSKLQETFVAAGSHPLKEQQKRFASYPLTKKLKPAYRNIRGSMMTYNNKKHKLVLILMHSRTKPVATTECRRWVRKPPLLS